MKTRREIIALGTKLGKMNIAAWAGSEGDDKNEPTLQDAVGTEQSTSVVNTRAAAWEEAENAKYLARFISFIPFSYFFSASLKILFVYMQLYAFSFHSSPNCLTVANSCQSPSLWFIKILSTLALIVPVTIVHNHVNEWFICI